MQPLYCLHSCQSMWCTIINMLTLNLSSKHAVYVLITWILSSVSATSVSYSADSVGRNINVKNLYSETVLKFPGYPYPGAERPTSVLTLVSWSYKLNPWPVEGLESKLCWHDQTNCVDITRTASGQTMAFNGKAAGRSFVFYHIVRGSGRLQKPIIVQKNQIIVNYTV